MEVKRMSIGQMIKLYRKEKGFTQNELAELIGVSSQAVSKWETDAGMPDISQIVPLARALEVSADKLLGLVDSDTDEELVRLRKDIGYHNISFEEGEATRIYNLAEPYFSAHPTNSEVAFICLESLTDLMASGSVDKTDAQLVSECERYANCVFRYETDADQICKTYYVISRAYRLLGEEEKATKTLEKLPRVFGDKTYWEAEFAFADKNMMLALQKCKESFAEKARFVSRCIRLARMISETQDGNNGLSYQVALNEYMLNIINAFLSGGDYMPFRQTYQKISLLCQMVSQYTELGNANRALDCAKQLVKARDDFYKCHKDPSNKHCLLFIEGDRDGEWHLTPEIIDESVSYAMDKLKTFPQFEKDLKLI